MSLQDVVDIYESQDTLCPCSSNEDLRTEWCGGVDAVMPWDEIDSNEHGSIKSYQALIESVLTEFMTAATTSRFATATPEERAANVERLMSIPQIPQRTAEWYAQAKQVLTASEFSVILGTPRAVGTLVISKVEPPPEVPMAPRLAVSTTEMTAMDWGVRFEPIVKQILTHKWGAEIVESGRLMHPTDPHLAASPDGLILKAADPERVGRLVEIKCPIRREVTGQIPFEYWCQMQIQMEVCDIDECEYVEVKINSGYKDKKMCEDDQKEGTQRHLYSGEMWLLQEPDTLELKYAYTALERKDLERTGWNVVEVIPWNLDGLYTQVVVRDRAWFAGTAEARAAFWAKVDEARAGIFVLPASSRPARAKVTAAPVVNVCKIED